MVKKIRIPAKYLNFANIFLNKIVAKLFKHFNINKYSINLELDKYHPIGQSKF